MRTEDQIALTAIKRKLNKVINLHLNACGRDDGVADACHAEFQLLDRIKEELEKRTQKLERYRIETNLFK